jgi:hypothetical protein
MQWTPDRTKPPYKKVSKNCGGGSAVKKFKMRNGGKNK